MNLRAIRKSKGLKVVDIANALGVSVQTVYNWESGARRITPDKLLKLSKLYKVKFLKLVVLLYGVEEEKAAAK